MTSDILEMAYDSIFYNDESPEQLASKGLIQIIEDCKDYRFLDTNTMCCYDRKLIRDSVKELINDYFIDSDCSINEDTIIDILDKIPEGTYGSIQIKHF